MAQTYEQQLFERYKQEIHNGDFASIQTANAQEIAIKERALRSVAEEAVAGTLAKGFDNRAMQDYSKLYGLALNDGVMGTWTPGGWGVDRGYNNRTPEFDRNKDGSITAADTLRIGGGTNATDRMVNARAVAVAVSQTMNYLIHGDDKTAKVDSKAAEAALRKKYPNFDNGFEYQRDTHDIAIFSRGRGHDLPVVPGPSKAESTGKTGLIERAKTDGAVAYELAYKYFQGEGKLYPQSNVEGRKWLEKSSALGYSTATADIGSYVYFGSHGYAKNEKEGVKWDLKAAVAGSATGQGNIAVDYKDGLGGIATDNLKAYAWAKLAKKNGNTYDDSSDDDTKSEVQEVIDYTRGKLTPAQRKAADAAVAAWKPGQDVADLIKAPAKAQAAGPKTGAAGGAVDIGDISKLTLLEKQQIQYDLEIMGLSTNQPKPFTVATPVSELDGNFGSGTRKSAAAYMKDNGFKTILEAREKLHKDATAKIEAAKPAPAPKPDLKAQLAPIIAKLGGDDKPINFFEDPSIKMEIEMSLVTKDQLNQDVKALALKDIPASLTAAGVKAEAVTQIVNSFSVNDNGTVKSDFLKALGDADGILDSKDKALLKDADALKAIAAAINNGTLAVANEPAAPKPTGDASLKVKGGTTLA